MLVQFKERLRVRFSGLSYGYSLLIRGILVQPICRYMVNAWFLTILVSTYHPIETLISNSNGEVGANFFAPFAASVL